MKDYGDVVDEFNDWWSRAHTAHLKKDAIGGTEDTKHRFYSIMYSSLTAYLLLACTDDAELAQLRRLAQAGELPGILNYRYDAQTTASAEDTRKLVDKVLPVMDAFAIRVQREAEKDWRADRRQADELSLLHERLEELIPTGRVKGAAAARSLVQWGKLPTRGTPIYDEGSPSG